MKIFRGLPSLFLLASQQVSFADARTWQSVIDREILFSSVQDSARQQLRVEQDPFVLYGEVSEPAPAPQSNAWVTLTPTSSPSGVPSDMPSMYPTGPTAAPTPREGNVDGNGGCNEGTMLYQVNMYDSFCDGWDGTMLVLTGVEDGDPLPGHGAVVTRTQTTGTGDTVVTYTETVELDGLNLFDETNATRIDPLGLVFQGGLRRGCHATADVCLMPRRCYEVVVQGGDFLTEVSWDIRPVILGADVATQSSATPLLEGGAPSECQFSLPDENFDGEFCPTTCSATLHPEHTEVPKIVDSLHVVANAEATSTPTDEDSATTTGTSSPGDFGEMLRDEDQDTRGVDLRNGEKFLDYLREGRGDRV